MQKEARRSRGATYLRRQTSAVRKQQVERDEKNFQFGLVLHPDSKQTLRLVRKFLSCPRTVTIGWLQKFLKAKLSDAHEYDILMGLDRKIAFSPDERLYELGERFGCGSASGNLLVFYYQPLPIAVTASSGEAAGNPATSAATSTSEGKKAEAASTSSEKASAA